jgi:hypothetical protein
LGAFFHWFIQIYKYNIINTSYCKEISLLEDNLFKFQTKKPEKKLKIKENAFSKIVLDIFPWSKNT